MTCAFRLPEWDTGTWGQDRRSDLWYGKPCRTQEEADDFNEKLSEVFLVYEALKAAGRLEDAEWFMEFMATNSDGNPSEKHLRYAEVEPKPPVGNVFAGDEKTAEEKAAIRKRIMERKRSMKLVPEFCRRKPRPDGKPQYKVQTTGFIKRVLLVTRDLEEAREFAQECGVPCVVRVAYERKVWLCSENERGTTQECALYLYRRVKFHPYRGLYYARVRFIKQVGERGFESFVVPLSCKNGTIELDPRFLGSINNKGELFRQLKHYSRLNRVMVKRFQKACDQTPPNISTSDQDLEEKWSLDTAIDQVIHENTLRAWKARLKGVEYYEIPI